MANHLISNSAGLSAKARRMLEPTEPTEKNMPKPIRCWLYKPDCTDGQIFAGDEIGEALKAGWMKNRRDALGLPKDPEQAASVHPADAALTEINRVDLPEGFTDVPSYLDFLDQARADAIDGRATAQKGLAAATDRITELMAQVTGLRSELGATKTELSTAKGQITKLKNAAQT